MPLDFSIPLQGRGLQLNDPFETMGNMRRMRDDNDNRRMIREDNERKMRDAKRDEDEQRATQNAWRESNGNPTETSRRLREQGYSRGAQSVDDDLFKRIDDRNKLIVSGSNAANAIYNQAASLVSSVVTPTGEKSTSATVSAGPSGPSGPVKSLSTGGVMGVMGRKKGLEIPFQQSQSSPEWAKAQETWKAIRPTLMDLAGQLGQDMEQYIPEDYDPAAAAMIVARSRTAAENAQIRAAALKDNSVEGLRDAAKNQGEYDLWAVGRWGMPFLNTSTDDAERTQIIDGLAEYSVSPATIAWLRKANNDQIAEAVAGKPKADAKTSWLSKSDMAVKQPNGSWKNQVVSFSPDLNVYVLPGTVTPVEVRPYDKPSGESKVNYKLPPDMQKYIMSLVTKYDGDSARIRAELERNMAAQMDSNPELDPAEVYAFMEKLANKVGGTQPERDAHASKLSRLRSGEAGYQAAVKAASKDKGLPGRSEYGLEPLRPMGPPYSGPMPAAPNTMGAVRDGSSSAAPPAAPPPPKPLAKPLDSIPGVSDDDMKKLLASTQPNIRLTTETGDVQVWRKSASNKFTRIQ